MSELASLLPDSLSTRSFFELLSFLLGTAEEIFFQNLLGSPLLLCSSSAKKNFSCYIHQSPNSIPFTTSNGPVLTFPRFPSSFECEIFISYFFKQFISNPWVITMGDFEVFNLTHRIYSGKNICFQNIPASDYIPSRIEGFPVYIDNIILKIVPVIKPIKSPSKLFFCPLFEFFLSSAEDS